MSWLPASGPGANAFERAFSLRPDLYAAWHDFAVLFFERGQLDARLLELCRLRIERMHGAGLPDLCEAMRRAREDLDPARREAIDRWWESDAYTPGERACLFLGFSKIALALGGLPDEIPIHEQPTPTVPDAS